MPIYEYACPACGVFPAMRRMADGALPIACPDCGQLSPRTVSAPAWLGASARQRRYDASAGPVGGRTVSRHGMACACCTPLSLRPRGPGSEAPSPDTSPDGRIA